MSVRSEFAALLEADWAEIPELADLRVIARETPLDDVKKPTALIRWKSITKHPQAPLSHRNVGLLLTLISPNLDLERAAEDLDGWTEAALDYLDTRYAHGDADVAGWSGSRLAVDILLSVSASKTESE